MINLDYPELLQLEFILKQTKDKMFMGGEIRRHASITQKVKDELYKREMGYDQYVSDHTNILFDHVWNRTSG